MTSAARSGSVVVARLAWISVRSNSTIKDRWRTSIGAPSTVSNVSSISGSLRNRRSNSGWSLTKLTVKDSACSRRCSSDSPSSHTRVSSATPRAEVLEVERDESVDGTALVPAHGRLPRVPSGSGDAPWITAFDAQCLGGDKIERIPEASAPLRATVKGLSDMAVLNQGLIDRRERGVLG